MASADFTVNGASCPPEAAVSFESEVELALLSTSFNTADWSIVGTSDAALPIPTITPAGSPLGATATFTAGEDPEDGLGISYLVQCKVNNGRNAAGQADSTLIKRAVVGVPNIFNIVPFTTGEKEERSSTHGWTRTINQALAAGGLMSGLGPYDGEGEREAEVITVSDMGKFAFQLDDGTLWVVGPVAGTDGEEVEWKSVSGGATEEVFDGDFGALLDSLCGAGTTVAYFRGDLGLVTTGSVVNTWENQIVGGSAWGDAIEFSAGVGLGAVSTGVGGKAGVVSNGTRMGVIATLPLPMVAPGTTPLHVYAVHSVPVGTPGTSQPFVTTNNVNFSIVKVNSGPNTMQAYCGAGQTCTIVSGSWGRVRNSWTGGASDILKWGSGAEVVGSQGNGVAQLGMGVFGYPNGTGQGIWDCVLLIFSRAALVDFTAAVPVLDAAVTEYFGAGVLV